MSSQTAPGSDAGRTTVLRSHERLSQDEFVRRFREVSRALWCIAAGHVGGRQAAEDLVQQAALVALERLDEFDPSTSFLAWMSKIVRLTTMNEVHKELRRRTAPADPAVIDSSSAARPVSHRTLPISIDGELRADQESFDDEMLAGLRSLDGVARTCLLLRVCLNTPYKELSAALDIPAGTAMSHVDRARKALREHMLRARAGTPRHRPAPRSPSTSAGGTP